MFGGACGSIPTNSVLRSLEDSVFPVPAMIEARPLRPAPASLKASRKEVLYSTGPSMLIAGLKRHSRIAAIDAGSKPTFG